MRNSFTYRLIAIILLFINVGLLSLFFLKLRTSSELSSQLIFFLATIFIVTLILVFLLFRALKLSQIALSRKEAQKQQIFDEPPPEKPEFEEQSSEETPFNSQQKEQEIFQGTQDCQSLEKYGEKVLSNIAKTFETVQGIVFVKDTDGVFRIKASYAFYSEQKIDKFTLGEGITGQVAKNKRFLYVDNVPEDYIIVRSGLGSSYPRYLLIFPLLYNHESIGIVEIASFSPFSENLNQFFMQIGERMAQEIVQMTQQPEQEEPRNEPEPQTQEVETEPQTNEADKKHDEF